MQPEDIPRAAPLVIAVYGQESGKDTLARTLAQDGYDVRVLKHGIVLRTPTTGSAGGGVETLLREGELAGPGARILSHGKLSIDTAARTVTFASTPIRLRRREYELLVYLARDPTRVFTRRELSRMSGAIALRVSRAPLTVTPAGCVRHWPRPAPRAGCGWSAASATAWLPSQARRSDEAIELVAADSGCAQDVPERALLDWLIAVDRDRDRIGHAGMAQDVVAATDALDVPALAFEDLDELLPETAGV